MATLTIDQILAAQDVPTEVVPVSEWGGDVVVRGLTRKDFDALKGVTKDDAAELEIAMLVACVVEPALSREQAIALREKSLVAFSKVAKAIGRVNGTGKADDPKSPAEG